MRVPFSPQQARRYGIDRATLLGGDFHRVMHGLYVSREVPITLPLRGRAVLSIAEPGAHLSHHTAAELWNLWAPRTADIHVCRSSGQRHSRVGVVNHQCRVDHEAGGGVLSRHGLRLTSPVGCFFELATCLGLIDLVTLGDGLVRKGRTSPTALLDLAAGNARAGAVTARRAVRLVRAGVDSQMETRLRLLLVMAGLPEPRVDVRLHRADGTLWRRLDLAYERFKVAVEYDGKQHAASESAWQHDITRRDELVSDGWRFVVVLSRGIYQEPLETVKRVERALRDAGWRGRRRPHRDWERHFPGYRTLADASLT